MVVRRIDFVVKACALIQMNFPNFVAILGWLQPREPVQPVMVDLTELGFLVDLVFTQLARLDRLGSFAHLRLAFLSPNAANGLVVTKHHSAKLIVD